VSAPTRASAFAFGPGVSGCSSAAVVDVDAVARPCLPSATPATPLPSPRTGPRRPAGELAVARPLRPLRHMESRGARTHERRLQRRRAPCSLRHPRTRTSAAGLPLAACERCCDCVHAGGAGRPCALAYFSLGRGLGTSHGEFLFLGRSPYPFRLTRLTALRGYVHASGNVDTSTRCCLFNSVFFTASLVQFMNNLVL
jgi:hypothetical protein